ncbi:MAG: tetraacyldisaccharide 4'-kinase, partial [Acidobacteria bacterium]|nr:tetraacyldisaccharide 4'-kinase [Acidobacteriota bacterium]
MGAPADRRDRTRATGRRRTGVGGGQSRCEGPDARRGGRPASSARTEVGEDALSTPTGDRGREGDGCRSVENPVAEKTSGVFLPVDDKKTPDVFSATGFSTDRHPSPFVISVGNIAFGGRGKTPTVAAIARLLLEMGERPAILSRGYGRRRTEDGVVVVSDGRHLLADVDRAGDEPLMLARDLPGVAVLVCEQRAMAGAFARHILRATALVLDDGFQHRQMARDVDVVLVTPGDLTGRRAPFGALREPVSALDRADVIIGDAGLGETTSEVVFFPPLRKKTTSEVVSIDPARFRLERHPGTPVSIETGVPPLAPGARVIALAGIAGPARFTRRVEDAG